MRTGDVPLYFCFSEWPSKAALLNLRRFTDVYFSVLRLRQKRRFMRFCGSQNINGKLHNQSMRRVHQMRKCLETTIRMPE